MITILPVPKEITSTRPYVLLAVLQVLDVLTTGWILNTFASASEGNPIVDAIFHSVGLNNGLALLLALKLAVVYTVWRCQSKVRLISAVYGAVVINNLLILVLALTN